jgi:hypothetical protein
MKRTEVERKKQEIVTIDLSELSPRVESQHTFVVVSPVRQIRPTFAGGSEFSGLHCVTMALSSLALRGYLHFFNSYSKTYGSLGAVIILMLWFYITGLAFLVGGRDQFDNRTRCC